MHMKKSFMDTDKSTENGDVTNIIVKCDTMHNSGIINTTHNDNMHKDTTHDDTVKKIKTSQNITLQRNTTPKRVSLIVKLPNNTIKASNTTQSIIPFTIQSIVMDSFTDTGKNMLINALESIQIDTYKDKELIGLLESFESISKSPYFHFASHSIYSIIFKLLNCKVQVQSQIKVLGFSFILEHYDSMKIFKDLINAYSMLDTFRIGNKAFRNHIVHKALYKIYEKEHESYNDIVECSVLLNDCIPFVEFVSKNVDDALCRNLMIVYSYTFLSKLKIDLLRVNKVEDLKDIDDIVISKIFPVLYSIKLAHNKQESNKQRSNNKKESNINFNENNSNTNCNDNENNSNTNYNENINNHNNNNNNNSNTNCNENKNDTLNNNNNVNSNNSNGKDTSMIDVYNTMLKTLFKTNNINSIILSIYKRLFNMFLFKNKRIFTSIKIPKIFSKIEKDFIFKQLRSNTQAFVNVFGQIDQKYIIKQQARVCVQDQSFNLLISSINENSLSDPELMKFYSFYMDYIEYTRHLLKIQMKSIEIFSEAFNSRIDKSFAKFIVCDRSITDFRSHSIIQMLSYYTLLFNNCKFIDLTELVSIIVDKPEELLLKHNISYFNNILSILSNISAMFNPGLIYRIVPILRKLVFYKDYTLNSGRLYYKLYNEYKLKDEFFTSDLFNDNKLVLMVKGSINHFTFENAIININNSINAIDINSINRDGSINTVNVNNSINAIDINAINRKDKMMEGVIDNALIFYMYYNPSFVLTFTNRLYDILEKKNKSTMYLLEYIQEYLVLSANGNTADDQVFNFISSIIAHIYAIFNWNVPSNPFIDVILNILLNSLKIKAILPYMALPYLMSKTDTGYLYRNYIDSCINCINDTLHLITTRIRASLSLICSADTVSEYVFEELVERESPVFFLYSIYKHSSLKRIFDKIDFQNDLLVVFVVLRNLKPFQKSDKELFIKHIEENVSDESVFELLIKAKEFYEQHPKGTIPVKFIH